MRLRKIKHNNEDQNPFNTDYHIEEMVPNNTNHNNFHPKRRAQRPRGKSFDPHTRGRLMFDSPNRKNSSKIRRKGVNLSVSKFNRS
jgi:hypothetical protein